MKPYPPLGILYISAWLEKHGYDNEVFDSTFSSKNELFDNLKELKPDVVGLYANLVTKVNLIRIMGFIRENLPNTFILLGGPDVRYNTKDYLGAGAHAAVIGEGESTTLELIRALNEGRDADLESINGLAFLRNGDLVQNPERKKIRDIDQLPLPNRKKIDIDKYLSVWEKYHAIRSMTVSTQRGCPYTCKWCSTAVYGQSYRRRSPEVVVDELMNLKEQYNPDSIWFVDDVFTVSHNWLTGFRDELRSRNAVIPFECITRADRLNEDVLDILKEAGCFRIWIGAESGSQKIIDLMDRRVDVNKVRDMIRQTRKKGMEAGTFIMLGYPGETEADIEETVHHLKSSNPDQFTITVAYPIKGTRLFQEVEEIQTASLDWNESTDRDRDFQRTYSRKYYNYAVRWVTNEVNWNKYLLKNQWYLMPAIKSKVKAVFMRNLMRLNR